MIVRSMCYFKTRGERMATKTSVIRAKDLVQRCEGIKRRERR